MALSFTYRLDLSEGRTPERPAQAMAVGAPIPALDQTFTGSIAGATGWNLEPDAVVAAPLPKIDGGASGTPQDWIGQSGLGFSCLDLLTAFSEGPP